MKLALALLVLVASNAHAAPNWCEHVFKTDIEKNWDLKQGSDGRVTRSFAAKMNVAYTIGGKTFPLHELVDKKVEIELQPNALEKAIAFDLANGGHKAQTIVEQFLNLTPDLRSADILNYTYMEAKTPDGVLFEANSNIGFKGQHGGDHLPRFYNWADNSLLAAIFQVKSIRDFTLPKFTRSDRKRESTLRSVTYSKTQLTPAVLESLIGERITVKDESRKVVDGYLIAAEVSDQGHRIALRIYESGEIRLLEYDLRQKDLWGVRVDFRSGSNREIEIEGSQYGTELKLNPHLSNTVILQKLDLTKPVFIVYAGSWKLEKMNGLVTLPTSAQELDSLMTGRPLNVILKTDQGEQKINQLNIFRIFGTAIEKK